MEFGAENVGDKAISKQYYFNANGFCISNIIREKSQPRAWKKYFQIMYVLRNYIGNTD